MTRAPLLGVSIRGVLTVAVHEFRLRIRAGRWRWLLGTWVVTLAVLTALTRSALVRSGQTAPGTDMFGALTLFVLALALLVVPALAAQSVNGDRTRGLLATLQTTLLTPADIAIGKLVAAWGTSVVFLIAAMPMALWAVAEGASGVRVAVALAVMTVVLGVVCAVSLCLSAVLARTTTSAVMAYLAVFTLTVGTVIAFAVGLIVTQTTETRTSVSGTYEVVRSHPERVWWLLSPNPFIVVADSAPRVEAEELSPGETGFRLDPLGAIGEAARSARSAEPTLVDVEGNIRSTEPAVWPYGLAVNVVIGIGAMVVTTRRLRTPYTTVPKSVRIA